METCYNIENIHLGHCEIWYGGVHLGHTYGGCNLKITSLVAEKREDATGDEVIEFIDLGCSVEVSCSLTEEEISKLANIFPTAIEQDGLLTFGKKDIGDELDSKRLVLKSVDGYYITIYKAVANPGEQVEVTYGYGTQRVWSVIFKGVPDTDRDAGEELFDIALESSSSSQSSSSSSSSSSESSSSSISSQLSSSSSSESSSSSSSSSSSESSSSSSSSSSESSSSSLSSSSSESSSSSSSSSSSESSSSSSSSSESSSSSQSSSYIVWESDVSWESGVSWEPGD